MKGRRAAARARAEKHKREEQLRRAREVWVLTFPLDPPVVLFNMPFRGCLCSSLSDLVVCQL